MSLPPPDPSAAAHYAAAAYKPAPDGLPLPTQATVATCDVVQAVLDANGLGECVRVQAAMLPAGGWVRVTVEGDAKSPRVKAHAANLQRVLADRGLEVVGENAVHTRVRGVYTPTKGDLRHEASRALRVWLREQGREHDAWIDYGAGVTRVIGVDRDTARGCATWLERWLAGIGLCAEYAAPVRVPAGWSVDVKVSRKAVA